MTDCQQRLTEAREAMHQLGTGAQAVEVDVEGQRVRYVQARRGDLQRYIRHLEAECGGASARTARRSPVICLFSAQLRGLIEFHKPSIPL
uniref:GpW protein n=1 Tax=Candidatus Kentrum sp. FM TaxID=2126340 RepID=A0A450S2F4_9GAMM|nr:MAG: gpW protein [Candidatus Kentron sp. FM]VFJ45991.1 MAG: gpW protein [Candidatus Kentron sp. FM]VFK20705.1 MAG: gpW protein [Candidatus Kentron sp. FM]